MEQNTVLSEHLHAREMAILRRLAAGLSDQQIANDLCLSLHTVKWYNRQIYGKLGVKSRTQAIACAQNLGVLHSDSAGASLPVPAYQLPVQSAPFIGRSRELSEVRQLLSRSRLLTLTGTGGTGKTRLALQVVEAIAVTFADGVRFVDLAPLADHALVIKAIAGALGVVEHGAESLLEILKRVLAQRDMLLLIDNFEHVITAAPLLSTLLTAAPRLKVLVTSREPLHLAGEQEYPVPPLTLPRADTISVQSLADSEAGALFVRRVQMAQPHFEATDANAPAIARICIRLDGLPLAIELAAARCKLLTPQALLARLEEQTNHAVFQVLAGNLRDAPPRQRTLRDTIAWSYKLLSADEQRLFARLAIFQGGRSLEAIEIVCAEGLSIDVFDGLVSLVDKSLVQQKDGVGGEPRFALLETIHAYARERLEASGEEATVRRRHAEYFVVLAERAEPELRLSGYDHWCRVFELELDNIRAALEWSLNLPTVTERYGVTLGVRLAAAIGMFWYSKGHHAEGFHWTQQLLARLDEAPAMYHPRFLISAGRLAWFQDLDTGQRLIRRALDCSRELGDALQTAWALTFLGYTMLDEPNAALPLAEEALASFRALNYLPGIAQALNIIGEIARVSGDDRRAQQVYEECLAVCQQTGEARRIYYMYNNLAYLAQHANDAERAMQLARQALLLVRDRRDSDAAEAFITIAGSLAAGAAPHQDQLRRAARLLGAAEAHRERMGAFLQPSDTPEYHRILIEVREHLDDLSFHATWAEGRRMTLEQAIAYALEEVGDAG
jgi:predicted ATPase/DNA-binding CsgD family transcriptional regulator